MTAESAVDGEVRAIQFSVFWIVVFASIFFPAAVLAVVWVSTVQTLHTVTACIIHAAWGVVFGEAGAFLLEGFVVVRDFKSSASDHVISLSVGSREDERRDD